MVERQHQVASHRQVKVRSGSKESAQTRVFRRHIHRPEIHVHERVYGALAGKHSLHVPEAITQVTAGWKQYNRLLTAGEVLAAGMKSGPTCFEMAGLVCGKCGSETPAPAHFCSICSARLPEKLCVRCGNNRSLDYNFCPLDGSPLPED